LAYSQQQDGPASFYEHQACVGAAVGGLELEAIRGLSNIADPIDDGGGHLRLLFTQAFKQAVTKGFGHHLVGQTASVMTAMSTPAAAVAKPFLAESLLTTRLKKEGDVGAEMFLSDMSFLLVMTGKFRGDVFPLMVLIPEMMEELHKPSCPADGE